MTPKQCAARLLLATFKTGKPHPTTLDRMQMAEALATRVSDEKRVKIIEFVAKIETPFLERLQKLTGEAAPGAADTAPKA